MKPSCAWLFLGLLLAPPGCTPLTLRPQSPDELDVSLEPTTRLVGEVSQPYGYNYVKIESVALVTNLAGTGEDPAPSPPRTALLHDMQARGVENPNELLASPNTALVMVRGYLPPGVQKGDTFDLEVQVPSRSQTTSLRGGWLMETRLAELAVLGNRIHEGHMLAVGAGPVLTDPSPSKDDEGHNEQIRGRVLGGGKSLVARSLGLVLLPDERSITLSAQIAAAINRRFHQPSHGVQTGVAKAKTDEFVELAVHPRYKDNVGRYLRVVRALAVKETPAEQAQRLTILQRQLHDHITAAAAALRLEAVGKAAVETLATGLSADDAEVRYYSAEALAYLDDARAAPLLADTAREQPALRAYALAALSAMDDVAARDELRKLLDVTSAETRYGAFRSLWAMRTRDAAVQGENLGGQFSYHVLATSGPPMIHVTRSYRPEIVLFGPDQRFEPPLVVDAGKSILVKATDDDHVTVSRFTVGQPDQKRVVSTRVDDVIRAIVELGGSYPDVVQALQQAKNGRALASRFAVDALPDRRAAMESTAGDDESPAAGRRLEVSNPLPNLFSAKAGRGSRGR